MFALRPSPCVLDIVYSSRRRSYCAVWLITGHTNVTPCCESRKLFVIVLKITSAWPTGTTRTEVTIDEQQHQQAGRRSGPTRPGIPVRSRRPSASRTSSARRIWRTRMTTTGNRDDEKQHEAEHGDLLAASAIDRPARRRYCIRNAGRSLAFEDVATASYNPRMKPVEINDFLQADVIGQEETLKFVSVAIFKHLQGERYGNLLMIGNSGTGKTTIMRSMERLYESHEEIHAVPRRLHHERQPVRDARRGSSTRTACSSGSKSARARSSARTRPRSRSATTWSTRPCASTRSTRSRRSSAASRTSPASTSSRALLTLIEGERILYPVTVYKNKQLEKAAIHVDTGKMLFLCAGAFETLYDQVYRRVTSPTCRVKLPDRDGLRERRGPDPRVLHAAPLVQAGGPVRLRHAAAVPLALRQRDHPRGPERRHACRGSSPSRATASSAPRRTSSRTTGSTLEVTDGRRRARSPTRRRSRAASAPARSRRSGARSSSRSSSTRSDSPT